MKYGFCKYCNFYNGFSTTVYESIWLTVLKGESWNIRVRKTYKINFININY